jgi:hypothetical protein
VQPCAVHVVVQLRERLPVLAEQRGFARLLAPGGGPVSGGLHVADGSEGVGVGDAGTVGAGAGREHCPAGGVEEHDRSGFEGAVGLLEDRAYGELHHLVFAADCFVQDAGLWREKGNRRGDSHCFELGGVGSLELGEGEASPEGEVVDEVVVRVVLGPRVRVHLGLGVHIRGRGRVVELLTRAGSQAVVFPLPPC